MTMATPPLCPRLRLSAGCRYPIENREAGKLIAASEGTNFKNFGTAPGVALSDDHAPVVVLNEYARGVVAVGAV